MDDGTARSDAKPGLDHERTRITVPSHYVVLPPVAAIVGGSIGMMRGSRAASLQFLVENAHRPPTTVEGWYFYKKTKNYKMILGGLKRGGADAIRYGIVGLTWATWEDVLERVGFGEVREVGAGFGSAVVFGAITRLPLTGMKQAMVAGLLAGSTVSLLRWSQGRLKEGLHR